MENQIKVDVEKKFKNEGINGGKKRKTRDNELNKWRHKENFKNYSTQPTRKN